MFQLIKHPLCIYFKGILFTAGQIPIESILMDIGSMISTLVQMLCKNFAFIFGYQDH